MATNFIDFIHSQATTKFKQRNIIRHVKWSLLMWNGGLSHLRKREWNKKCLQATPRHKCFSEISRYPTISTEKVLDGYREILVKLFARHVNNLWNNTNSSVAADIIICKCLDLEVICSHTNIFVQRSKSWKISPLKTTHMRFVGDRWHKALCFIPLSSAVFLIATFYVKSLAERFVEYQ